METSSRAGGGEVILVYKDPHCSGLKAVDCNDANDIEKTLAKNGCDESTCGGDVVHYVFVDPDGYTIKLCLDFT